jgi:triosephosphate isomerase
MIKNAGAKYVILGHSERRINVGETDEMVAKKVAAAAAAGLFVVLCVGEPFEVRRKGPRAAADFVRRQVARCLKGVRQKNMRLDVCYEPVWAVSTNSVGVPCHPDEAETMIRIAAGHAAIKLGFKNVCGIYGGSVNNTNAAKYLAREYTEGVLVGAASLDAKKIGMIVEVAARPEN